jgi:hypothetical protein
MDRTRVEAILSGMPAGRRKAPPPKPLFKRDDAMEKCLGPIGRLCASSNASHRGLQLTSSQLPPIF